MNIYEDHTFVVCAYKESEYLEECVKSVLNQTIKSNVILATSTPNSFIENICKKYFIEMYINPVTSGGIGVDWNFAVSSCKTNLVTVAHQDDVYLPEYLENILYSYNSDKKQIIFFTDYAEIINGKVSPANRNMKVKRIISKCFNSSAFGNKKWFKKRCLSLGCPIGCPSVTLQTDLTGKSPYVTQKSFTLDWYTWLKLSAMDGVFAFIDKKLMYHRRHKDSETSKCIGNNVRASEDYEMLKNFWPKPFAKLIMKFFSKE